MAKKWLVLLAAVVALGGVACGGGDDDGDGGSGGTPGGSSTGGICDDQSSAEYQACVMALADCMMSEDGACYAETQDYLNCPGNDMSCFEEKGRIYTDCVQNECPDAAPCVSCDPQQ